MSILQCTYPEDFSVVWESSITHSLNALQLNIILANIHQRLVHILADLHITELRVLPSLLALGQGTHNGGWDKFLNLLEALDHVAVADPACTADVDDLGDVPLFHLLGWFFERVTGAYFLQYKKM